MKKIKTSRLFVIILFLQFVLTGCDDDSYRGQRLSGKWFGDLGVMIGNQPAIGSVIEFRPYDYSFVEGFGNEYDYYHSKWGVNHVRYSFTWRIINGIIYLRFDNPSLDCNIRDYSLSDDFFIGYMDGIYSSTYFSLRGYDKYWPDYGYFDAYYKSAFINDSVQIPLNFSLDNKGENKVFRKNNICDE